jgi:hypothetical protein
VGIIAYPIVGSLLFFFIFLCITSSYGHGNLQTNSIEFYYFVQEEQRKGVVGGCPKVYSFGWVLAHF